MARLSGIDGGLDATYCEAMACALARYLACRYGRQRPARDHAVSGLAPWRVRRIADYVDAHLAEPLRIHDLSRLVGLSPGYLHRAFRDRTGKTPLGFINQRRIERAMTLLRRRNSSVAEIALAVGFTSPSHFARTFRDIVGASPSSFRSGAAPRRPVSPVASAPDGHRRCWP